MKGNRKRTPLVKAKQDSNLKDMLAYYNDKSKILAPDVGTFQPIYEYDQLATQEILPPKSNFQNFVIPFNSEQVKKSSTVSGSQANSRDLNSDKKYRSRQSFSREGVSEMNKKLREIRTSHYRRQSQRMNDYVQSNEGQTQQRAVLTARQAPIGNNSSISRQMMMSSSQQRVVQRMLASATSHQYRDFYGDSVRPKFMRRGEEVISMRSSSTSLRFKRNPHVIYQFESHLKSKRVDDNPKVLGNIIKKKFQHKDKGLLFDYINGLIKRRQK